MTRGHRDRFAEDEAIGTGPRTPLPPPPETGPYDLGSNAGEALFERVATLVRDLRRAGVPTGLTSTTEAYRALGHVDLGSLVQVRLALRCTLVKRVEDEPVFDALFEARFAPVVAGRGGQTGEPGPAAAAGAVGVGETGHLIEAETGAEAAARAAADLLERIVRALADGDTAALAALAEEAAERHGGFGSAGSAAAARARMAGTATAGDRYHLQRTLRALNVDALGQAALRVRRGGGQRRDELTERLDRTEIAVTLDRFVAALAYATRRQQRRQQEDAADTATPLPAQVPLRPEDLDIAAASVVELRQLRRAVRPLAQRLAARIARRQRRPRGALDMRRTIRRSLTSGGVPLDPTFRRRLPHRPDLWVLCDVSGSVAEFARFTIGLLTAIHDEVPRLRSFLFVDDIVEVTKLLSNRTHDVDPFAIVAGAGAPLGGRRSDWGTVLARFRDVNAEALTRRSTILLTGDARTHDHDPRADVARDLVRRTRGVWLLDPEPATDWSSVDAAVPAYRRAGVHVLEVRTLSQLADAVDAILGKPMRN